MGRSARVLEVLVRRGEVLLVRRGDLGGDLGVGDLEPADDLEEPADDEEPEYDLEGRGPGSEDRLEGGGEFRRPSVGMAPCTGILVVAAGGRARGPRLGGALQGRVGGPLLGGAPGMLAPPDGGAG